MKKFTVFLLTLILTLSFSACSEQKELPPEENVSGPVSESSELSEETEKIEEPVPEEEPKIETLPEIDGEPLSEEEIGFFNDMFYPITDDNGNMEQNPWGHFFLSYYDDIREINFPMFIWYFPSDGSKVEEEEFQKLREVEAWGFDNCETLEEMPVPVHSISKKDVDAVLMEYAGITSDDLDTSEIAYLEEYDCYYTSTSDWTWGMFICSEGERIGDTIYLYGESELSFYSESEETTDMLVLTEEEGKYKVVSHQHYVNP